MSTNPPPCLPVIGQIVTFTFSDDFDNDMSAHDNNGGNLQAPAMIVAVKDSMTVNLRVFCNGHRILFTVNSTMGKTAGQWSS